MITVLLKKILELLKLILEKPSDGGHNYSTEEKLCGKWVDGSNLYEKTIYFAGGEATNHVVIPHGITNLKRVVYFMGTIEDNDTPGQTFIMPRLPLSGSAQLGVNKIDNENIDISSTTSMEHRLVNWYIVLRYTKNN